MSFHPYATKKTLSLFIFAVFFAATSASAATFHWTQTDWSGGTSTTATATNSVNKTEWNKFYSGDAGLVNGANVTLVNASSTTYTQTSDADFNAGTLATSTVASGSVKVIMTPATMSFSPKVDYTTGTGPTKQVVADFNGDGYQDIALTSNGSQNFSIFIGVGNGTFNSKIDVSMGGSATALVAADFNGDSKLDIATNNYSYGRIFLGVGNGTFLATSTNFVTLATGNAIGAADFNKDGKMDVVTGNQDGNISFVPGNGDGTFGAKVNIVAGGSYNPFISSITVGDFNADTKMDFAAGDVSTGNQVSVFLGNGNGTFAGGVGYSSTNPQAVTSGDINGDGKLDLVVNNASGFISAFTGSGTGTFTNKGTFTVDAITNQSNLPTIGDFNNDSMADVAVVNTVNNKLVIFPGNGNGTFGTRVEYALAYTPTTVASGDFNGDGRKDLSITNSTGNVVSVYLNVTPSGQYAAATGTLTSSIIDLGTAPHADLGSFSWTASTSAGATVSVKVRTSTSASMAGTTTAFSSCSSISNGQDLTGSGCVNDTDRYLQYQVTLYTDGTASPSFDSASFVVNSQNRVQTIVSSPFNTEDSANVIGNLTWANTLPADTNIQFQIRTAPASGNAPGSWTSWLGPTGTGDYYSTSTSNTINSSHRDGVSDQWVQYRAMLTYSGDYAQKPVLDDVDLTYVVNARPEFQSAPTISHIGSGNILISYAARDTDTSSLTSCKNCVIPSFKYSVNGGSTWISVSSGLPATSTASTSVATSSYSAYSLIWNAKSQLNGTYAGDFRVQVTVDDKEGANNTAASSSNSIVIDLKNPTLGSPAISVIATTTPAKLTFSASDDTALQMCISLDGTQSNCVPYNSTSTISLANATDTIYAIFIDAFGNTATTTLVTPAPPQNMMVRDASAAPDYQELIAWKTATGSFGKYHVWYSTDGSNYQLLSTISDSATNYYLHRNLSNTNTYYYKTDLEDAAGNVSRFSEVVSDQPNGLVDSSSTPDHEAPIISGLDTGLITNTAASIAWTTNEAANSVIYFGTTTGQYSSSSVSSLLTFYHSITLTGLATGTTYYYYVTSADASGNMSSSNEKSFMTTDLGAWISDVMPPEISEISTGLITNNAAVISWFTNEPADSLIEFGTSTGVYTSSLSSPTLTASHSLTLTGLATSTIYYYRVTSKDAALNMTVSNEFSFTTTAIGVTAPDVVAPTISSVETTLITDSGAVISWSTNEASDSRVSYGLISGVYTNLASKNTLDTSHSVSLTGLASGTVYYYVVSSTDSSGNTSTSSEYNFTSKTYYDSATVADREAAARQAGITEGRASSGGGGGGGSRSGSLPDILQSLINLTKGLSGVKKTDALVAVIQKISTALKQLADEPNSELMEANLSKLVSDLSGVTPLVFSAEPKVVVTSESATIIWETNKVSNSLVAIAARADGQVASVKVLAPAELKIVTGDPNSKSTKHEVVLDNLKPDTFYRYQIRSVTPLGKEIRSDEYSFRTKSKDNEIGTYSVTNISKEKARFSWTTQNGSNSEIKLIPYRNGIANSEQARIITDKLMSTIHNIEADDLEAGVKYDVDLISRDAQGRIASKRISGFSTSDDNLPPQIMQIKTDSAMTTGKKAGIQTVVSWSTNEPANGQVLFQKGTGKIDEKAWESTQIDQNYTKKHFAVITKFQPGSVYRFKVLSTDSSGKKAETKVYTVLTPKQKETVFSMIINNFEEVFGWTKQLKK